MENTNFDSLYAKLLLKALDFRFKRKDIPMFYREKISLNHLQTSGAIYWCNSDKSSSDEAVLEKSVRVMRVTRVC